MIFTFLSSEDLSANEIPLPLEVLRQSPWMLDNHNTPFLAGKAGKPDHSYGPLSDEEIQTRRFPKLNCREPMTEDEKKVVGDISDFLKETFEVIIADARNFKEAEEKANLLGYRSAKAGEYLQMLWYLRDKRQNNYGWYFCYQGRVPNYAILACFDRVKGGIQEIIFDTHYNNLEYMSGNMESLCFFVKP